MTTMNYPECAEARPDAGSRSGLKRDRMSLRYWVALNVIDALLTSLAFNLGAAEANPMLNLFTLHLGNAGMLFVKVLFAVSVGGVLWERRKFRSLNFMNLVMVGVVIYNMLIITYTL